MSSWTDQCPARGAGLEHAHWNKCDPNKGAHPGTETVHAWNVCCDCGETIGTSLGGEQPEPEALTEPPVQDHLYVPTIAGACLRCRLPVSKHPGHLTQMEAKEQAEDNGLPIECAVNHGQVQSKLLIDDGGLRWSTCTVCGVMLEPKVATGEPTGPLWGKGRGVITQRYEKVLKFLAHLQLPS